MAGFKTTLVLEVTGNRLFKVVDHDLIYENDDGAIITVPIGQETDLASTWKVPIVAELYDGVAPMSSVVHDHLYRTGELPRKECDDMFYFAMYWESEYYKSLGKEGIDDHTRLAMYRGVRDFGKGSYKGPEEWSD